MTPWRNDLQSDLRRLDELSLRRSIVTPETGQEPHIFFHGVVTRATTVVSFRRRRSFDRCLAAPALATRRLTRQRIFKQRLLPNLFAHACLNYTT